MSTTLSVKEEKISHTTVNTFNTSIRKLYDKLSNKFRIEGPFFSLILLFFPESFLDVIIFLSILKPLPALPVEYAGELSLLQSNVMEILEAVYSSSFPIRRSSHSKSEL
jgi:hypothetical protein